jgi:dipeptidyl aminopeptidase/acylaminoacyl peptidase
VSEDDAPTLLLAGVKDDLVPISHSRNIEKALGEKKIDVKIVEYPNSGHGLGPEDLKASFEQMAAWFDKHLGKK